LTERQFVRFYMRVWRRGRSAHSQFHTVSWISSFSQDSKLFPGESWHRWEITHTHTPFTPDLMSAKFLLLPNRRSPLKRLFQDTDSIRNSYHMKYISFEHLQWLCSANVRKIQKACCSKGRAPWTKSPPLMCLLCRMRPWLFSQFYRTAINVEWLQKTNKSLPFEKSQYPWGGNGGKCPLYYFFYLRVVFFCILSWRRAYKNWGERGEKGCMYFRDWLKPIFPLFLPSLLCKLKFQTSMVVISKVMPMVLVVTQTRTLLNNRNIPFQPTCTLCVIHDILQHTAAAYK